jgi:urease accessory protein
MTEAEAPPRALTLTRLLLLVLIVAFVALFPRALPNAPSRQGFVGGFLHPIEGFDHRLAMVAVGMWGAALGRPLIWTLPIAFPLVMAVGGVMGMHNMPFPNSMVEQLVIALSVFVLGVAVACRWAAPVPVAIAIVSVFAIFHGYAHGREYHVVIARDAFAAGFVLATGLLHVAGITVGWATDFPRGSLILRAAGTATAVVGAIYLLKEVHFFA